jgi:hypothetical protein
MRIRPGRSPARLADVEGDGHVGLGLDRAGLHRRRPGR